MKKGIKTGYELSGVLTEIGKKVEKDLADKLLRTFALDTFKYLVNKSAWETGFLRSRWDVSINVYPSGKEEKNPGGQSYQPAVFPSLRIQWGDTVYLYNNVEYAKYLEYGINTSERNMRAQPMVTPAYVALLARTKDTLRALNNEKIK